MKKILFITEATTRWWAFMNEIDALKKLGIECHLTDSIDQAKKILDTGVDKVVIFPFAISYPCYEFDPQVVGDKDLKYFAGYCFWKQEIFPKNIPTIIVNIYPPDYDYVAEAMEMMKQQDWKTDTNVTFFGSSCSDDGGRHNEKKLVELIAA